MNWPVSAAANSAMVRKWVPIVCSIEGGLGVIQRE